MATFKRAGKKSEEAKMLLALPGACSTQSKLVEDALGYARDALGLFREVRDEKMEAVAWLDIAKLLICRKGDAKDEAMKEAQQAVNDALLITQRLGDKRSEAEVLHSAAQVKAAVGNLTEAVALAEDG